MVFISTNGPISQGEAVMLLSYQSSSVKETVCTRFILSADPSSRSTRSFFEQSETYKDATCLCVAMCSSSSLFLPVSKFMTPAGTSEVWQTSPKIAVAIGCACEPSATTVLPEQSGAPMAVIRPRSDGVAGAMLTATPWG